MIEIKEHVTISNGETNVVCTLKEWNACRTLATECNGMLRKVPATKIVRAFTGLGLRDAKYLTEFAWESAGSRFLTNTFENVEDYDS